MGALCRSELPAVFTHRRRAEVACLRSGQRPRAALFVKWSESRAISGGTLLGMTPLKDFRVNSLPVGLEQNPRILTFTSRMERQATAKQGIRRIRKMPISRRNRVNYLKHTPKFERASLLALYSPIHPEKVTRSALDKTSGNLLFWYDYDRVKMGEKCHLLILRAYDGGTPLREIWVPVNKKLY